VTVSPASVAASTVTAGPGFGGAAAVVALLSGAILRRRR